MTHRVLIVQVELTTAEDRGVSIDLDSDRDQAFNWIVHIGESVFTCRFDVEVGDHDLRGIIVHLTIEVVSDELIDVISVTVDLESIDTLVLFDEFDSLARWVRRVRQALRRVFDT